MKRIAFILAALMCVGMMVTSCHHSSSSDSDEETTTKELAPTEAPSEDEGETEIPTVKSVLPVNSVSRKRPGRAKFGAASDDSEAVAGLFKVVPVKA